MKSPSSAKAKVKKSTRRRNVTRTKWIKPIPPRKQRKPARQQIHPDTGLQVSNDEFSKGTSSSPNPNPSTTSNTLKQTLRLLTLLWQRNRNQHRRSPWWKHLSLLKRRLEDLLDLENTLNNPVSSSSTPTAKTIRVRLQLAEETRRRKAELENWIRNVLVPNAYASVSSGVVKDAQFAGLGLVVLALLAEVAGKVVGYPDDKSTGRGGVGVMILDETDDGRRGQATIDDMGEVVERSAIQMHGDKAKSKIISDTGKKKNDKRVERDGTSISEMLPSGEMDDQTRVQEKENDRKRRKGKKNVIDDMFAGFV